MLVRKQASPMSFSSVLIQPTQETKLGSNNESKTKNVRWSTDQKLEDLGKMTIGNICIFFFNADVLFFSFLDTLLRIKDIKFVYSGPDYGL